MGRPPCCDKVGIKKGPWTPEEDIILVSYIQEHGPGNWRSVPTNTGLLRCSKSCRLRWTNYLRPGIKRGNFTAHEEGMIIHLQALLGNKWAAIASYLPQRTDNDIKNYWNTHLKKKLKKFQAPLQPHGASSHSSLNSHISSGADIASAAPPANHHHHHISSTYASSTENISRLLEGWMRSSPNPNQEKKQFLHQGMDLGSDEGADNAISHEELDSILSFENMGGIGCCWDKPEKGEGDLLGSEKKLRLENSGPPLTVLEKWLWDEMGAAQVEEIMELSPPSPPPPMF